MTVSSTTNKSGPYLGNGSTVEFDYEFRVLDPSHLTAVVTQNGVDTIVPPTDYTVSGVGGAAGGALTFVTAPATGQSITIIRNAPFTQQVDLENQGAYYAETVEAAFDLAVMRDQQLAEGLSRAVQIPVGADSSTLAGLIEDIVRLGDSADQIDIVAGISGQVATVAGISADVQAVAAIASDVTAVADIAADVTAVASDMTSVSTAAANIAAIIAAPAHAAAAEAAAEAAEEAAASLTVLDEDDMASDSAVSPPSQQSTKAYVSSSTSYQADGSGSVVRKLHAKAKEAVSVYDFGASPTNTAAQNLAAFNAAIAAGNANGGGELLIPRGVFTVSSKIVIGKKSTISLVGHGEGSIIRGGAGFTGPVIEWGDNVNGGDITGRLRGFAIDKPVSGTATGIKAIHANIGIIEDVLFLPGLSTAIDLTDCYAFRIEKCKIKQPSNFGIYSSTGAHNLVVERNSFFNTGASAINIDGGQTNLLVQGNDMEYCGRLLTLWQASQAITFCHNYVEGTQENEFVFLQPVWGFMCDNNELSLLGANILNPGAGGSGVTTTIDNICGGSFKGNSQYDEKIAWGSNVWGLDVGKGKMVGAMSSLAEAPWTAPGAYTNGWTQTSAGTFPVGYQRSWDGQVSLRGQVTAGASSSGQAAFTLPAQYRPSRALTLPVVKGGGIISYVSVFTTGVVAPAAANAEIVNLEGVRFQAAG